MTDADCGNQHVNCATTYGQGMHCQAYAGATPAFHQCGCTPADGSGTADSCAGNSTGKTVCDSNLLYCRAPRDFEPPANGTTCDTGYAATVFNDGSGGTVSLCAQTCSADGTQGTCTQSWTTCDAATDGVCVENDCGPGYTTDSYYGSCTAAGGQAGTCLPFPNSTGTGYVGICELNGSSTGECAGFFGDSQFACAAGDICLGTGGGNGQDFPVATCFPSCDAKVGCADPSELCVPLNGAPDSGVIAGYCVGNTTAGGDTMGACGTSYQVCRTGEFCDSWSSTDGGVPAYFTCDCDPASTGTDSCAINDFVGAAGNVVCDSNTLRCRQPRDLEPWFGNALSFEGTCSAGYEGVSFLPDGGDIRCVQDCSAGSVCNATWAACDPTALLLADGGSTGGCFANRCGVLPDAGFDLSASWTTCDAGGAAGRCQPLPSDNGDYLGYCLRYGSQTKGESCNGFLGDVNRQQNCTQTEMCLNTGFAPGGTYADGGAIPVGTCFAVCNAGSGGPTKNCSGAETCTPYATDPASSPEQAGTCQ